MMLQRLAAEKAKKRQGFLVREALVRAANRMPWGLLCQPGPHKGRKKVKMVKPGLRFLVDLPFNVSSLFFLSSSTDPIPIMFFEYDSCVKAGGWGLPVSM